MMTEEKKHELAMKMLNASMLAWEEVGEELAQNGDIAYQHTSDYLSLLAVLAGTASYYLGYRGAFGYGDSGHEKALEKALRDRTRIRKALGYTRP